MIEKWRIKESIKLTIERRPDLINKLLERNDISYKKKEEFKKIIKEIIIENNT
jgi:tRNA (guanine37-N1)-methyltransferase